MKQHKPLESCLHPGCIEAGCDEAGRGCLAGPVFAAAVVLKPGFRCEELNDSKQLSERERNRLRPIIEQSAMCYAVEMCTPDEIDELNILWASVKAMHKALSRLTVTPEHILIDGNRFHPFQQIPHTCVIKGDGKYLSIAAASVLAKTYRDEYMQNLHNQFPVYGWMHNKGYPTRAHREAIKQHGITIHHRQTFHLIEKQLKFEW
ncbi:MAG: ribonuclease HII [Petrimonas sp.]|jgi:ribonuclease HII|uniref:Ribonuclease HII n=1 Tax=bioreactor metagenome TaxID=1076179 RepID=A0A644Z548_9ZZZZ|nr:ribonuclease HII [Petrimonas sp.]NLU28897.1 ribonuclease HII [Bacteroidales bacterium]BBD44275.1 Ribonuclease HII [Petrimonas sp. IBARAKI]HBK40571.1 ribonuclease HII [Porphyromonadaceae bacterium]MDD2911050.1 ribonuclease HII [Petrimonas sp.]